MDPLVHLQSIPMNHPWIKHVNLVDIFHQCFIIMYNYLDHYHFILRQTWHRVQVIETRRLCISNILFFKVLSFSLQCNDSLLLFYFMPSTWGTCVAIIDLIFIENHLNFFFWIKNVENSTSHMGAIFLNIFTLHWDTIISLYTPVK